MKFLIILSGAFFLILQSTAWAAREKPLFIMEKSHNPENIMVIHAQIEKDCKFAEFENDTYINYYWLMNKTSKKKVHPLIVKGVTERFEFKSIAPSKDRFTVDLNDLKEVKHDLKSPRITVASKKIKGKCQVKSALRLGPSNDNQIIDLNRVYCKVDKNVLGVPKGCDYIELEGTNVATGKKVEARFNKG